MRISRDSFAESPVPFQEQLVPAMLRGWQRCRGVPGTTLLWVLQQRSCRKDSSDSQIWGALGRLDCSVSSKSVWGWSGSTSQAAAPAVPRAVPVPRHPHQPRAAGEAGRGFWSHGNISTGTPDLIGSLGSPVNNTEVGIHHLLLL